MEPTTTGMWPEWITYVYWVVIIISIISMWKLFVKANRPGWASIIPIYNTIVFIEIAKRPVWWIILLFIPIVNIVIGIMTTSDFVRAYGKGTGFVIGAILLPIVFLPILAFGDSQYVGGQQANMSAVPGMDNNQNNTGQTNNPNMN